MQAGAQIYKRTGWDVPPPSTNSPYNWEYNGGGGGGTTIPLRTVSIRGDIQASSQRTGTQVQDIASLFTLKADRRVNPGFRGVLASLSADRSRGQSGGEQALYLQAV